MFSVVDGDGGHQGNNPPFGYDVPPRPRRSGRREAGNGTGGYPNQNPQQGQAALPPGQTQFSPAQLSQTPPYGMDYSGQGHRGTDDPGWGSGARDYGRPAPNGRRDPGRDIPPGGAAGDAGYGEPGRGGYPAHQDGAPYHDGPPYQDGYPGPYDPRGFDRR
jgi:hypothetical protein